MQTRQDIAAYQACLIGGALGDALGGPIEFQDIAEIRKTYGEAGIQNLVDPEFTDDTQMTLFTAEGLLRFGLQNDGRDIQLITLIFQSYLRWLYTQGEPIPPSLRTGFLLKQKPLFQQKAPGQTCLNALSSGKMGSRNYALNNSKGCGGVMRVAPIGLYFWQDPEKAFRLGADAAAITHSHASGYLSAGAYSGLIALLVVGNELKKSLYECLALLKAYPKHEEVYFELDRALEMHASGLKTSPEQLAKMGKGWPGAVGEEALAMSVFCALNHTQDFKQGVLAAVNHSGDSDSTGILTGQILGLINGLNALPEDWKNRLKQIELLQTLAEDLFRLSSSSSSPSLELINRYLS